ncbi:MAG: hypothetical protein KKF12_10050, partial [Proteobacteria bacterium]|nr:hypothetical protein [Pseudomonadota bacterium]
LSITLFTRKYENYPVFPEKATRIQAKPFVLGWFRQAESYFQAFFFYELDGFMVYLGDDINGLDLDASKNREFLKKP